MRLLILLVCFLVGCGSIAEPGQPGPEGPQGPAGMSGADGAPGAPGKDATLSGSRLRARYIVGEDCTPQGQCSRKPYGDYWDSEREEMCVWAMTDDNWHCMPPILDATEWYKWPTSECDGPSRVFVRVFAPANLPSGTSLVRVLSNDPDYHETILMRAEPIDVYYSKGPDGQGPCKPTTGDVLGFPKPWFVWAPLDLDAFVAGELIVE